LWNLYLFKFEKNFLHVFMLKIKKKKKESKRSHEKFPWKFVQNIKIYKFENY